MWNDPSGADPGKPPIDGEKLQGPSSYRGENGIIIEEPASVELEGVTVKASDDGTSAGIFGGHGLNIWQAAAMQQAANDPEQQAAFARSRERGASIETAVNIQFLAGSAPFICIALVEAAPIAISALQTAGAASTATSASVASYSGSGAATLKMGGGSGAIGAGGVSSGVTWTGIAEAAEGAYVLSSAAISAQEAAATANAVAVEKIKDEKYITLFRGVSEMAEPKTMYDAAKRGYAVPTAFLQEIPGKQPTTNPDSHVFNSKYSVFSSWTLQENVAMKFATNEGKNNGIILTVRVKVSEMIEAEASNEYFPDDFEVLLYGIRKASPRNVTKTMYKK